MDMLARWCMEICHANKKGMLDLVLPSTVCVLGLYISYEYVTSTFYIKIHVMYVKGGQFTIKYFRLLANLYEQSHET